MRAQQLFGIRHGIVLVAGLHRVPRSGVEHRAQGHGGPMDQFQFTVNVPVDRIHQSVRAEDPTGAVQRDRRAHGRPVGHRAQPQNHIETVHRSRENNVVYRNNRQSHKTTRVQSVSPPSPSCCSIRREGLIPT